MCDAVSLENDFLFFKSSLLWEPENLSVYVYLAILN